MQQECGQGDQERSQAKDTQAQTEWLSAEVTAFGGIGLAQSNQRVARLWYNSLALLSKLNCLETHSLELLCKLSAAPFCFPSVLYTIMELRGQIHGNGHRTKPERHKVATWCTGL